MTFIADDELRVVYDYLEQCALTADRGAAHRIILESDDCVIGDDGRSYLSYTPLGRAMNMGKLIR